MPSPPANVRRHFLPWDRPLLAQAVEWLAAGWDGGGPLDLSRLLVVVPTRQSGRRLREALAEFAAGKNQAVFPPRVVSPDVLIGEGVGAGVATRLDSLLAWADVFRELDLDEFRAVFPVDPPARSFAWAFRLAQQFARLQATLAEGGLRIADIPEKLPADFPEATRWGELAELEGRHAAALAAWGAHDLQAARIAVAHAPPPLAEVERVVLLAVPDPLPLALDAIAVHARALRVDVAVFAPPDEAAHFDGWGRPLPSAWERREIGWPAFEQRVHGCADPAAQAERLTAAAMAYPQPDGRLALGVADPEVLPLLESELTRAGLPSFNPEGRPLRAEALHTLLAAFADLAREPGWNAVAALARCPDFLAYLQRRLGGNFAAVHFLAALDRLRVRHLPADLATALALSGDKARPGLEVMAGVHRALTENPFPESALHVLADIFSARRLERGREDDACLEAAATAWTKILRLCAAARKRFPRVSDAEWWELALKLHGDEMRVEEKPPDALELQGWLELLFENAPHLAVAGLNDGLVPDALAGDAFLPESLRARLGLKTNAARFARDAYLLQAIAACRPRLDVLFGKTSSAGEPLRPSRLLLRCADADLPARVAFLFRELPPAGPGVPWMRGWRLAPARPAPPTRVAVTALRAWLDCPLRFCLRFVLRMEALDPAKDELDALDFGTLVHGALEALGRDEALRDCADAAQLREFLHCDLDRQARQRFGAELTLPLLIQFESARQRLSKVAEIEAGERAAGWRTIDVERKFEVELGGITVSGKIDRIDRHRETGAVRVLDYKTSDRPVTPADAHLRPLRRGEQLPDWRVVECEDKPRTWCDLQLPLYELVLAAEFGAGVTCGYFNLPKAVGETAISLWDGLTPEVRAAARRCAEGVCQAIRGGEFWPPRELAGREAEWDDFATLFHQGAAASVDWPKSERGEATS